MKKNVVKVVKRFGSFSISRKVFGEHPEVVMAVMGRCVIFKCDFLYHSDRFEYIAWSPDFDEVPEGAEALRYTVVIGPNKSFAFYRENP